MRRLFGLLRRLFVLLLLLRLVLLCALRTLSCESTLLLTESGLLIGREHAEDLLAQRAARGRIGLAAGGMALPELAQDRLDLLLLIGRKIQGPKALIPAAVEAVGITGSLRRLLVLTLRLLILLRLRVLRGRLVELLS